MNKFRFLIIPVIIFILVFGMTSNLNPVLAEDPPPALPSSFYGEVQFASSPPIIGDFVEAYVPGVTAYVVRDAIGSYPTDKLVYALSIPGDNLLTPEKDGGLEGDEVTLKINERIVALGGVAFWYECSVGFTSTSCEFERSLCRCIWGDCELLRFGD